MTEFRIIVIALASVLATSAFALGADWEKQNSFSKHTDWVRCIAFSPDGSFLATGSHDKTVKIWNLRMGSLADSFADPSDKVSALAWSHDGKRICACCVDGTILTWDLESRQLKSRAASKNEITLDLGLDSERGLIAVAGMPLLEVLNSDSGKRHWVRSHGEVVFCLCFNKDYSMLATGSKDNTIRLWTTDQGTEIKTLSGHTSWVRDVKFSPVEGILASGSDDNSVRLWEIDNGLMQGLLKHESAIYAIAFSADGALLAVCEGRNTQIWNVKSKTKVATLIGHQDEAISVAFSPDGQTLATGGRDNSVVLWRRVEKQSPN